MACELINDSDDVVSRKINISCGKVMPFFWRNEIFGFIEEKSTSVILVCRCKLTLKLTRVQRFSDSYWNTLLIFIGFSLHYYGASRAFII